MAQLRLYKDFYKINYSTTGESYTLINPVSLSVDIVNLSNNTTVESVSVIQESTGVYYFDITTSLYNYSNTYEARWLIQYISDSNSLKTLKTRFKIESNTNYILGNVVSSIDIDIDNSRIIDLHVDDSEYIIEIEN